MGHFFPLLPCDHQYLEQVVPQALSDSPSEHGACSCLALELHNSVQPQGLWPRGPQSRKHRINLETPVASDTAIL